MRNLLPRLVLVLSALVVAATNTIAQQPFVTDDAGTIDVVALQERLMIARIHFQDGVAELSLDKKAAQAKSK